MAGSSVRRALLLTLSLLAVLALLFAHVHLHHAQATAAASQQLDLRLGLASAGGAVGRRSAHHLGHLTPRRALRQQVITVFPNNNIGTAPAVQRPVGVKATLLQNFLNNANPGYGYGAAPTATSPYYAPAGVQPYYPSSGRQTQAQFTGAGTGGLLGSLGAGIAKAVGFQYQSGK